MNAWNFDKNKKATPSKRLTVRPGILTSQLSMCHTITRRCPKVSKQSLFIADVTRADAWFFKVTFPTTIAGSLNPNFRAT